MQSANTTGGIEAVASEAGRLPPTRHPTAAAHPLGPLLIHAASPHPTSTRGVAAVVLLAAGAVLGLAMWLTPDPSGVGTHRQLGLPGCTMILASGYPCPTCGMTTAFSHAVRGRFIRSFHAQPAGFLLAVSTFLVALAAGSTLVTTKTWALNWYRIRPWWTTATIAGVVLLGWAYKIVVAKWF